MKAYLANITEYSDRDILDHKMSLLCMERLHKAQLCKNEPEQKRSVAAGLLLQQGLENHIKENCLKPLNTDEEGRPVIHIEIGENGKPFLPDYPELCFSLSHSGDYVAAIFDVGNVGMDIQQMRAASPERMICKFHPEEQAYFARNHQSEESFFLLWCIKEAYMKYTGKGFSQGFLSFYGKPEDGTVRDPEGNILAYFKEIIMPDSAYKAAVVTGIPLEEEISFALSLV